MRSLATRYINMHLKYAPPHLRRREAPKGANPEVIDKPTLCLSNPRPFSFLCPSPGMSGHFLIDFLGSGVWIVHSGSYTHRIAHTSRRTLWIVRSGSYTVSTQWIVHSGSYTVTCGPHSTVCSQHRFWHGTLTP